MVDAERGSGDGEAQPAALALHGLSEPLRVTIDFEAEMVDDMIRLLTDIRSRMLPPPSRH